MPKIFYTKTIVLMAYQYGQISVTGFGSSMLICSPFFNIQSTMMVNQGE